MPNTIPNSWKGPIAGFVATVVLSAILLFKSTMELMPELNIIGLLASLGSIGRGGAWFDHFFIGTVVWGLLFTGLDAAITGIAHWLKGLIFGVCAWLLMMVVFMPVVGAGLFGAKLGITVPVGMLVLHLIYGAVLGTTYGLLGAWAPAGEREGSKQS